MQRTAPDHRAGVQFGRPGKPTMLKPAQAEPLRTVSGQHDVDVSMIGRRRCRGESERDGAKAQLEKPVSEPGLQIIIELGRRLRHAGDLSTIDAQTFIDRDELALGRLPAGPEYTRWAAFYESQ